MNCLNVRHRGFNARGPRPPMNGAGEGNRTLVVSLEGFCSTIELHPPSNFELPSTRRSRYRWWRELDSNQRRRTPTGLQPVPFSHSGTPPSSYKPTRRWVSGARNMRIYSRLSTSKKTQTPSPRSAIANEAKTRADITSQSW